MQSNTGQRGGDRHGRGSGRRRPSRSEEEKKERGVGNGIPPFLIRSLDGPDLAALFQICLMCHPGPSFPTRLVGFFFFLKLNTLVIM